MNHTEYIPGDEVIDSAQELLGVRFHPDYIAFIKSGYDLGDSVLEPLEIDNPKTYVDMYEYCKKAWEFWGVPRSLLPIVHDNADFYCVNQVGGVEFWSHDARAVTESWSTFGDWVAAMKAEA